MTKTYWLVGHAISVNTLGNGRADYGKQILATLSPELAGRFGSGFEQSNLARMVRFARQFPDYAEAQVLAERVSWSHIVDLLAIKSKDAQAFYTAEAATKHLSLHDTYLEKDLEAPIGLLRRGCLAR